jgi:hypothetical protein
MLNTSAAHIGIAFLSNKLMSIYGRMFVYQKGKANGA